VTHEAFSQRIREIVLAQYPKASISMMLDFLPPFRYVAAMKFQWFALCLLAGCGHNPALTGTLQIRADTAYAEFYNGADRPITNVDCPFFHDFNPLFFTVLTVVLPFSPTLLIAPFFGDLSEVVKDSLGVRRAQSLCEALFHAVPKQPASLTIFSTAGLYCIWLSSAHT
jgi:hypothetical protein